MSLGFDLLDCDGEADDLMVSIGSAASFYDVDEPEAAAADGWCFVALDLRQQQQEHSSAPPGPQSALTILPMAVLARLVSFLEWGDLLHLRMLSNKQLSAALSQAWPQIAINTWALLGEPASSFDVGRTKLSMVCSVERLRRGEMPAAVVGASLRVLAASNSAHEPATKMAKMESGEKESAVAKLIAVMYQSMLATARGTQSLIRSIEDAQRNDASNVTPAVAQTMAQLETLFQHARRALHSYRKKVVVPAPHLRELRRFEEIIEGNAVHLAVLRDGWQYVATGGSSGRFPAAMVWTRQQMGVVLRPTQKLETHCGRLLVAPAAELQLAGTPKCSVECVEQAGGDVLESVLTGNVQPFGEGRVASFDVLKFSKPSRQKPVLLHLQCELKREGASESVTLKSACSYPMLVYAHQKQLVASYEILLKHYIFRDKSSASWPSFSNALQEFFCARLLSDEPGQRLVAGMSSGDLEYIRSKYYGRAAQVREDQTGDFFQFIGPFFFSLMINRSYVNLWSEGILAGFLGRESLDLTAYGQGAFLLRYSTQVPGEIVISFVSGSATKHYLVSESDVSPKSRQALAAFLWKTPNLKFILSLPLMNGEHAFVSNRLTKRPKEEVLREWLDNNIPPVVFGYQFHN